MKLKVLEEVVIEAFCSLSTAPLSHVDEFSDYSHNNKDEFIEELNKVFNQIKSNGINALLVQTSTCKFCYPNANTYSFHHPVTNLLIIRYVIDQVSQRSFRVQECRNLPLPKVESGMPF
ncbi:hypothetical protein [Gelidibacter maritimus]|uniref:Uncharacterized protein n=1 Tax=Gelidibacter maritimus TaxID=2761487 RepID=A0A7W2R5B9_9FLAO|nr:hypothetical protein [Gelidibacter maritimus]MBA6153940.1 hypothetical protein [Gelidibacter maritimus]